jgi:hypothetical protein
LKTNEFISSPGKNLRSVGGSVELHIWEFKRWLVRKLTGLDVNGIKYLLYSARRLADYDLVETKHDTRKDAWCRAIHNAVAEVDPQMGKLYGYTR